MSDSDSDSSTKSHEASPSSPSSHTAAVSAPDAQPNISPPVLYEKNSELGLSSSATFSLKLALTNAKAAPPLPPKRSNTDPGMSSLRNDALGSWQSPSGSTVSSSSRARSDRSRWRPGPYDRSKSRRSETDSFTVDVTVQCSGNRWKSRRKDILHTHAKAVIAVTNVTGSLGNMTVNQPPSIFDPGPEASAMDTNL
ncbi:hypothetical protein M231_06066 [Tremella mesenterica]|uniref:Uncharacterized protein n=1 Tax=Tremella mesenterica TaxID=5217 RepID=A0A4Q1BGI2_TREME|nr:hypothetical protein M231_06066 [Tremella mesenterica]